MNRKQKNNAMLAAKGELLMLSGFTGFYVKSLDKAIHRPGLVLFAAALIALSGVTLFVKSNLAGEMDTNDGFIIIFDIGEYLNPTEGSNSIINPLEWFVIFGMIGIYLELKIQSKRRRLK